FVVLHHAQHYVYDVPSLHDALPIFDLGLEGAGGVKGEGELHVGSHLFVQVGDLSEGGLHGGGGEHHHFHLFGLSGGGFSGGLAVDRKSTRLNSSHVSISYAVFCLKK